MNNKIVDLILPETFNIEKAKRELNKQYILLWEGSDTVFDEWFPLYAPVYAKELDAIKNNQPKYDREFWKKVAELNKEKLEKMSYSIDNYPLGHIYFFRTDDEYHYKKSSVYFKEYEIDLINKQYRLLQEIYYSRLEA